MGMQGSYLAYEAIAGLAALLTLPAAPYLLWRGYGEGLGERLGRLPDAARRLPAPPLWIHAASVGETLAAGPLVARVRERCPDLPIVLSATTLTGRRVAATALKPDAVTLLPVDAWRIVDRALHRVRPRAVVIVETELWPGLLRAAAHVADAVVLVSGCVSARSFARYQRIAPLMRAALANVTAFGMQTAADAERIVTLGGPAERVHVTGSLKASRVPPVAADPPPVEGLSGRPLLVAASTQPGEEEFVLDACRGLWDTHPALLLLLAPRRPERFEDVATLLRERGLRVERRSQVSAYLLPDRQVLLLDSVGELMRFLPLASAVFVGGTVAPVGGHNVLEPAAYAKPVSFGPHTEDVAAAADELVAWEGGVRVRTPDDLRAHWAAVLAEPAPARAMGERARGVAEASAVALDRTWELLAPYLESRATA
jgi:3-deoxy-D-manno-octulosonic-acid transferase